MIEAQAAIGVIVDKILRVVPVDEPVCQHRYARLDGLPKEVREIAWKAQVRLCARYRRLVAKGKPKNLVTTAIAREMAAFAWAIAQHVEPTPAA